LRFVGKLVIINSALINSLKVLVFIKTLLYRCP